MIEAEKTPMLKDFNLARYESLAPTILFIPIGKMGLIQGFTQNGRIAVGFSSWRETTDFYKQIAAHEMIHIGAKALAVEWLDEAFTVLAAQRVDEEAGREALDFGDISAARNDYAVGMFISAMVGGDEVFAEIASQEDAYAAVAEAFDKAQGCVSFEDFSFANIAVRAYKDNEQFEQNLKYMDHIAANPFPEEDDALLSEIRAFYALPMGGYALGLSESLSELNGGTEPAAAVLDVLTIQTMQTGTDIFFSGEDEWRVYLDDAAVKIAYEKLTVPPSGDGYFIWEEAVTA